MPANMFDRVPKSETPQIDPQVLAALVEKAKLLAKEEFPDENFSKEEIEMAARMAARKNATDDETLKKALSARVGVRPGPVTKSRIINERGDITDL
jgi:hypothetical protein